MAIAPEIEKLTYRIIGACMKVHTTLGPGCPEEYYQKALEHQFDRDKLSFETQKFVPVEFEGVLVGQNYLDFLVEEKVIVEIKSVREFLKVHEFQVIKYMIATHIGIALLVNFGNESLVHKRLFPPLKISNSWTEEERKWFR